MCDDCDSRGLAEIEALSREHERIRDLIDRLRRTVGADGEASAAPLLAELQDTLGRHVAREEVGLFAQLAGRPGFEHYLDELCADHAHAHAGLLALDPARAGWSEGLAAHLDGLVAHIELEEYDLFPASRMLVDDAGWAEVSALVAQLAAETRSAPALG